MKLSVMVGIKRKEGQFVLCTEAEKQCQCSTKHEVAMTALTDLQTSISFLVLCADSQLLCSQCVHTSAPPLGKAGYGPVST